jgi:hypothetical protein
VEAVVRWHGAVQAQDYGAAKWGLALRAAPCTDAEVDRAYDEGRILRTHVLRPTWHFVLPEDIRWMLRLTGPRVHAKMSYYYARHKLDPPVFTRAGALMADALRGGARLTRSEIAAVLRRSGIDTDGLRTSMLFMHAELEQIVCSGGRRGKQHTYALLDEVAPAAKVRDPGADLEELAMRYLRSHGPARAEDLAWWAGVTVGQARLAIEGLGASAVAETVDGATMWTAEALDGQPGRGRVVRLLPAFDEYTVAYTDRRHHVDHRRVAAYPTAGALLSNVLTVDGHVYGFWRRRSGAGGVTLTTELLADLPAGSASPLLAQVARYGRFLGVPARMA